MIVINTLRHIPEDFETEETNIVICPAKSNNYMAGRLIACP